MIATGPTMSASRTLPPRSEGGSSLRYRVLRPFAVCLLLATLVASNLPLSRGVARAADTPPSLAAKPNEVLTARTETSDTVDNGDGTLTTTLYSEPVDYRPSGSASLVPIKIGFDGTPIRALTLGTGQRRAKSGFSLGHANDHIAADLGVSRKTVEVYLTRLYRRLESRAGLAARAQREGWLE
jgi:Bacterial regulatory proteins, luxR family